MSNGWIVSAYPFAIQPSAEEALAEAIRLANKTGKTFRIYRVKAEIVHVGPAAAAVWTPAETVLPSDATGSTV